MFKVFTTYEGGKKLVPEENIIPRFGASAIILDGSKILLIRLKGSDKFWFPGGTIEEGEVPGAAAKREAQEETGLDVTVGKLLAEVQNNFYFTPRDVAWQQHDYFYECTASSNELIEFSNPDSEDVADGPVWVELGEIQPHHMQDYGFEVISLVKTASKLFS